ncbi:MAG: biotin transporter BioY [Clostridiaceae bacterium]|nr:biotin transporter BioY [Clostridiaceae bacterium]
MKKPSLIDYLYASMFTALVAVSGYISIPVPFSPVPITAQSMAVMLTGCILNVRQSIMSMVTFLLLGTIGIPVFAGGRSGIGVLAGPTGGYLIGFLVAAIIISLLKGSANKIIRLGMANILGSIIIYIIGTSWLMFVTGTGLYEAIAIGVLPYIPGDLLKCFAATLVGYTVNNQLAYSNMNE